MSCRIVAFSLALVATAFGQVAAGGDLSTIEGSVVNLAQNVPIANATVLLTPADPRQALTVNSSADGHFVFRDVASGKYRLSANRRGFVDDGREASLLTLQAGQSLQAFVIRLTPLAALAGRVFDDSGEPVPGAVVEVLRPVYAHHKRMLIPVSSTSSNDLGEFRAHSLTPGRYLVRVQYRAPMEKFGYAPVFFPNAEAANTAQAVELPAGQTQQGINFLLRRVPVFSIAGRLTGPAAGKVTSVWFQAGFSSTNQESTSNGKEAAQVHDGSFEITGVRPGRHLLSAEEFGSSGGPKSSGRVVVDVSDRNVESVQLSLLPVQELTGRVVMDAPSKRSPESFSSGKGLPLVVHLIPREFSDLGSLPGGPVERSGEFKVTGASAQAFDVELVNLAPDLFLKTVRRGTSDVDDRGVDLSQGAAGGITLVLSDTGGTVDGTVQTETAAPASAIVIAVPSSGQNINWKESVSDQQGHFTLQGIAPGDYRLYAFGYTEMGAPEDPDLLKRLEGSSQKIRIDAHDRKVVSIRVITASALLE